MSCSSRGGLQSTYDVVRVLQIRFTNIDQTYMNGTLSSRKLSK